MWYKFEIKNLETGKEYKVMDSERFIVKCRFDGLDFVNVITKKIVKNVVRIWL